MHANIWKNRINQIEKALSQWDVSALLIEDPVDLFYLTGARLSFGKLIVEPAKSTLYTDHRYYSEIQTTVQVPCAVYNKDALLERMQSFRSCGFDADKTSYALYAERKKQIENLTPINSTMRFFRAIKDQQEISEMQRACKITEKGYIALQKKVHEGMQEKDLALFFSRFIVDEGAICPSFDPNVSFGANGSYPHHRPSDQRLEKNDIILVDIGANYQGYCADMTRVFMHGEGKERGRHLYTLAIKAYEKAASYCKEGALVKDLDAAAREELRKHNMDAYFTHSLGHGVGLDIHEFPSINQTGPDKDVALKAGMVITIEPGIYLPGEIGVRYENTLLITKNGYENLFTSTI